MTMGNQSTFDSSGYVEAFYQPFRMLGYAALMLLTLWMTTVAITVACAFWRWDQSLEPAEAVLVQTMTEAQVYGGVRHLREAAPALSNSVWSFTTRAIGSASDLTKSPITSTVARGVDVSVVVPAMSVATRLWMLKCLFLVSMLPIVVLAYMLGYWDGMVNRRIRRDTVDREQSGLYHRGKFGFATATTAVLLIYTTLPIYVPLNQLVLAWAAAAVLLARLQWSHFKKYR